MRRGLAAAAGATALATALSADLSAAARPAASDRVCPESPASAAPVATVTVACAQAHSTAVGEQPLCACATPRSWRFERRSGTRVVQHWATKFPPMTGPGDFEVTQVDVDGHSQPAWLVARLQGVRSGLSVSTHSLCVVWPQQPTRAPLCRELSEWRRRHLRRGPAAARFSG